MRFLVHVIEEMSIHKKVGDVFEIQECKILAQDSSGESDKNEFNILTSDSFYIVEAPEPVDAVIEVANIIRVEDEDGDRTKLAFLLKKQKEKEENNPEICDRLSGYTEKYSKKLESKSSLISPFYEIEKMEDGELSIELHCFFFYVSKETDIMQILEK